MEFAINYSPQAAALVEAGTIHIDRFKCPDWPDLIAEARQIAPVYVHFALTAGGGLANIDWAFIEQMLADTDTPYVNLHLAPSAADFPKFYDPLFLTEAQREEVIARMIADVTLFTTRFGPSRVVVENIPYRGQGDEVKKKKRILRPCVEPDVFTRVLDATGARLLFDLSHARITADTLGLDPATYIEAFPLARLKELHITGIQMIDGVPNDHMHFTDEDWRWFEWFMARIHAGRIAEPTIVAFEYGGVTPKFDWRSRTDVIESHVPRMLAEMR